MVLPPLQQFYRQGRHDLLLQQVVDKARAAVVERAGLAGLRTLPLRGFSAATGEREPLANGGAGRRRQRP